MTQPISPKIHIPYIPNSKIPNAKRRKKKSRSPINPQGQESREKESQGWAEAETGQVPKCRGSEKGQRTERPRVSDIRTGESS
jgi:hypothetical protein